MAAENRSFNLFSKTSINGRALGGHLFTFPSSFSSSGVEKKEEEEGLVYGLRENPRKSFRVADPEFRSAIEAEHFVQDRESETESMAPTRKRSNRNRMMKSKKPRSEQMSSVSNTSLEEEIALCLLMLSRDEWETKKIYRSNEELLQKVQKSIPICRALRGHSQNCFRSEKKNKNGGNEKSFECPFCGRVFSSGQALGGHKRSHLLSSTPAKKTSNVEKSFIDLNLPVVIEEDDDCSVVSDP